jgi:hypothetical protein
MAKRLSDTDVWKKEWFRKLKPKYKCFWNYILSNCNIAGIWDSDFDLASFQIGEPIKREEVTKIFEGQILIFNDGKKWFIKDFVKFQYGEILNEKSPVHRKVIDSLKSERFKNHTLYDTLYNRVHNRGKEEEENKDKEEDKEEEENSTPQDFQEPLEAEILEWPSFDDFWNLYDKKVDRKVCEKKWVKLTQEEKEQIIVHVPKYVESTPDVKYRKNPETYLNNKSWLNEIISNVKAEQPNNQSREEFGKELDSLIAAKYGNKPG